MQFYFKVYFFNDCVTYLIVHSSSHQSSGPWTPTSQILSGAFLPVGAKPRDGNSESLPNWKDWNKMTHHLWTSSWRPSQERDRPPDARAAEETVDNLWNLVWIRSVVQSWTVWWDAAAEVWRHSGGPWEPAHWERKKGKLLLTFNLF